MATPSPDVVRGDKISQTAFSATFSAVDRADPHKFYEVHETYSSKTPSFGVIENEISSLRTRPIPGVVPPCSVMKHPTPRSNESTLVWMTLRHDRLSDRVESEGPLHEPDLASLITTIAGANASLINRGFRTRRIEAVRIFVDNGKFLFNIADMSGISLDDAPTADYKGFAATVFYAATGKVLDTTTLQPENVADQVAALMTANNNLGASLRWFAARLIADLLTTPCPLTPDWLNQIVERLRQPITLVQFLDVNSVVCYVYPTSPSIDEAGSTIFHEVALATNAGATDLCMWAPDSDIIDANVLYSVSDLANAQTGWALLSGDDLMSVIHDGDLLLPSYGERAHECFERINRSATTDTPRAAMCATTAECLTELRASCDWQIKCVDRLVQLSRDRPNALEADLDNLLKIWAAHTATWTPVAAAAPTHTETVAKLDRLLADSDRNDLAQLNTLYERMNNEHLVTAEPLIEPFKLRVHESVTECRVAGDDDFNDGFFDTDRREVVSESHFAEIARIGDDITLSDGEVHDRLQKIVSECVRNLQDGTNQKRMHLRSLLGTLRRATAAVIDCSKLTNTVQQLQENTLAWRSKHAETIVRIFRNCANRIHTELTGKPLWSASDADAMNKAVEEVAELHTQVTRLTDDLRQKQILLDTSENLLNKERDQHSLTARKLDEQLSYVRGLNTKADKTREELSALQSERAQAQLTIGSQSTQINSLNTLVSDLRGEVKQLRALLEKTETEANSALQRVISLETEKAQLLKDASKSTALADLTSQVTSLSNQLMTARSALQASEQRRAEAAANEKDRIAAAERSVREQLEATMQDLCANNESAIASIRGRFDAVIKEATDKYQAEKRKVQQSEVCMDTLRRDNAQVVAKNRQLERELAELKTQLTSAESQTQRANLTTGELSMRIAELEDKLVHANRAIAELQSQPKPSAPPRPDETTRVQDLERGMRETAANIADLQKKLVASNKCWTSSHRALVEIHQLIDPIGSRGACKCTSNQLTGECARRNVREIVEAVRDRINFDNTHAHPPQPTVVSLKVAASVTGAAAASVAAAAAPATAAATAAAAAPAAKAPLYTAKTATFPQPTTARIDTGDIVFCVRDPTDANRWTVDDKPLLKIRQGCVEQILCNLPPGAAMFAARVICQAEARGAAPGTILLDVALEQ